MISRRHAFVKRVRHLDEDKIGRDQRLSKGEDLFRPTGVGLGNEELGCDARIQDQHQSASRISRMIKAES